MEAPPAAALNFFFRCVQHYEEKGTLQLTALDLGNDHSLSKLKLMRDEVGFGDRGRVFSQKTALTVNSSLS